MAREYANGPSWMHSQKGMISLNAAASAIFISSMGVINGGKPVNEVQKGDQIYDKGNKQNMKLDPDEISTIAFLLDRVIQLGGFANMFSQETKVGSVKADSNGFQIYHKVGQNSSTLYVNESNNNGMPVYYLSVIFKNNQQEVLKVNITLGGFEGLYKLKNYFDSFPVLAVLAANAANANQGGGNNGYSKSNNYNNSYNKSNNSNANQGGGYNQNANQGGGYGRNNPSAQNNAYGQNASQGGGYGQNNAPAQNNAYGQNANQGGGYGQNNTPAQSNAYGENANQGSGYGQNNAPAQSNGYAQNGNNAADMMN